MKIESLKEINGPNVYSHRPVVLMRIDLGKFAGKKVSDIPGLRDRLIQLLPAIKDHYCNKGRPGGFVEWMDEGTHLNHVIEHAVIEMLASCGLADRQAKLCYGDEFDPSKAVVETTNVETTKYLMPAGAELVNAVASERTYFVEEKIVEAKQIAADLSIGPSTACIVEAAGRRGIPWSRENDYNLVQLGYGKNLHLIRAALTDQTSCIGTDTAGNKDATKRALKKFSIPVPRGVIVRSETEAMEALEKMGPPVVVKPLDGRQGKGVSLNISTVVEIVEAFRTARDYSSRVLVEELFEGNSYRVLVINGKMQAASERLPCYVTGDGVHTISELIEIENQNPLRGEGHEKPLTRIKINSNLIGEMQKGGLRLEDVPEAGRKVMLCSAMNLSTGGTAKDVTDDVHPTVRNMCERASRIINLDICGIDLVLMDISQPLPKENGGVIEINAAPGLRMHVFPTEGVRRDVGEAVIDMLYPSGKPARIPIIAVTGTNGKTTVTRMIGHVFLNAGWTPGVTTTDGILLNGERIIEGDTTGPVSAKAVLGDRAVDIAVLETARGGIVRRGLGYDWSDIGVLTNISEDHIGQDGIRSIDDLINIKALVAERVREGGTLILNADDENVLRVLDRERVLELSRNIVYFSLDGENPVVVDHLHRNGTAYFGRDGFIVEALGQNTERVIEIAAIPTTMKGLAEFEIANALAAVAACRAQGRTFEEIFSLNNFRSSDNNPGRNNLYRVGGGHVLIDYGHNPKAFAAICRMASCWHNKIVTGIIGVPGDRDDSLIEDSARVAARGFHRVIIKQDYDLRGRKNGEVADIMCRAIKDEAPDRYCDVVLNEVEAFAAALLEIGEDDVVVMFYDKLAPIIEALNEHNAVPVTNMDGSTDRRAQVTA